MPDQFYLDMRGIANQLLAEYGQGTIQLVTVTRTANPSRPWDPQTPTEQVATLNAVARTVDRDMVDGTTVMYHSTMVVAAPTSSLGTIENIGPEDYIIIDGRKRSIARTLRVPEAGPVVAWNIILGN